VNCTFGGVWNGGGGDGQNNFYASSFFFSMSQAVRVHHPKKLLAVLFLYIDFAS
jgi:hypothetical protein